MKIRTFEKIPIALIDDIFGRNPNWAVVSLICFEENDIIKVFLLKELTEKANQSSVLQDFV